MPLVHQCGRCGAISDSGTVEDLPPSWEQRVLPMRGDTGNRSSFTTEICGDCDDSLYEWFQQGIEPESAAARLAREIEARS